MDPVTLAPVLRDYGPWGLLAIALVAIGWVAKQWKDSLEARVTDAAKIATGLEKSSQTTAAVSAALESRSGHFERLGIKVDEISVTLRLILAKLDEVQRQFDDLRRGGRS